MGGPMSRSRTLLVAVLALTALALAAVPATAAPNPDDSDTSALLARVATGEATSNDIARIKQDRDLAAVVIDPERTQASMDVTAVGGPSARTLDPAAAQAASSCYRYTMRIRHKSYLGDTIFRYNFAHSACYSNGVVSSIYNRQAWFDEKQSIVTDHGEIHGFDERVGTNHAEAYSRGRAELCVVKYGCYANVYPHINSNVFGHVAHVWTYGGVSA